MIAISLIAIIFALGYAGVIQNEFLSSFLIQIMVMFAIPLFLYTFFVSKSFKNTLKDTGIKKISGRIILISVLLGIVLYIINSYVADLFQIFITLFGYEKITAPTQVKLDYGLLLREFVLTAILPGICEEFLHRGIMLMSSKKYHNPKFALITSSIIFGLIHLNINQFFYATILGALIGYVGLVSDNIIPCMIIHFMNNFLSTYFYYGHYLKFPLVELIEYIETIFMTNIIAYILMTVLILSASLFAYVYLTKLIIHHRIKDNMYRTISALNLGNVPIHVAQSRLNNINYILSKSTSAKSIIINNGEKSSFIDKIPLIFSIILGLLITISSFIWGII